DGLDEEAERVGGVVIRGRAVAGRAERANACYDRMSSGLHLGCRSFERGDDVGEVVEAFAALGEPICMNARPVERFDQFVLRAAAVERELERPFGCATVVLAPLSLRPEDPAAPGAGGEPRIEYACGLLEVANNEPDLKRREPLERRHHAGESTQER